MSGHSVETAPMQAALDTAATKLQRISEDLDKAVLQNATRTVEKLEIAMTKLFKLAFHMRREYGKTSKEAMQSQKFIFHQNVVVFKEVETQAGLGIETISQYRKQVAEVENNEIAPTKDKISELSQKSTSELDSIKSEIETANASLAQLEKNVHAQESSVSAVKHKIEERTSTSKASDMIFTIGTLGIGNLLTGHALDPFGFHEKLDNAVKEHAEAQRLLDETKENVYGLRKKELELAAKMEDQKRIETLLQQLSNKATAAESRYISLESRISNIKGTASRLLAKVKEIVEDVGLAEQATITQKDFALGILELCEDALIDSRLLDEVQSVKDEILGQWEGEIPVEVQEKANGVVKRMNLIKDRPSITEVAA